ncbi:MAG: twin-arginine translocase TatA/TatE family subunit [Candidatus Aquicultorales bacterium]
MPFLNFKVLVIVLILVLLVLGPSKLPQLGKSLGEGIREFRKSSGSDNSDEA